MYTIQSLWTQAREKLPVTTVIINNRKYQILIGEYAGVGAIWLTALNMLDLGNPDMDFVNRQRPRRRGRPRRNAGRLSPPHAGVLPAGHSLPHRIDGVTPMNTEQAIQLTVAATRGRHLCRPRLARGCGPRVVTLRAGRIIDITSPAIATMRDLCEAMRPHRWQLPQPAKTLVRWPTSCRRPRADWSCGSSGFHHLQAVKAAGVTFATSMLERVIEEKARGNPALADGIRRDITRLIGDDLSSSCPARPKPWP